MKLNFRKLSKTKKILIFVSISLLLLITGFFFLRNYYIITINIPLIHNYAQIDIETRSVSIFIPKDNTTWLYINNFNFPETIVSTNTTIPRNMAFIQITPIFKSKSNLAGSHLRILPGPQIKQGSTPEVSNWQTYTTSKFSFQYPPGWQVSAPNSIQSYSQIEVFDPKSAYQYYDNKYTHSLVTQYHHLMFIMPVSTRYSEKVYTPADYIKLNCISFHRGQFSTHVVDQGGKQIFIATCSDPAQVKHYVYNNTLLLEVDTVYEDSEIANKFVTSVIFISD